MKAVFSGSDEGLLALAGAKEIVERTGAKLLTGPVEALAVAMDKWATYEFCIANGFECAPSSLPEGRDGFAREYGFPVVVKPREGYGSLHLYIAKCKEEMGSAIAAIEKVWAGEPVDGLLSRLFELKEEQRRVRE